MIINNTDLAKRKTIILIAIILCFSIHYESLGGNVTFVNSGRRVNVPTEEINNHSYVYLENIYKIILPSGTYNSNNEEINSVGKRLKFAPGSFFILYETSNDLKVSQMSLPAIKFRNRLAIPLISFMQAIESLKIYTVISQKNIFYLNSYKEKSESFSLAKEDEIFDNTESKSNYEDIETQSTESSEEINEYPDINDFNEDKDVDINNYEKENIYKPFIKESFSHSTKYMQKSLKGLLSFSDLKKVIKGNNEKRNKIEMYDFEEEKVEKQIQQPKKSTKHDVKVSTNEIKSKGLDVKNKELAPPGYYILPKNLIRKELEEKK